MMEPDAPRPSEIPDDHGYAAVAASKPESESKSEPDDDYWDRPRDWGGWSGISLSLAQADSAAHEALHKPCPPAYAQGAINGLANVVLQLMDEIRILRGEEPLGRLAQAQKQSEHARRMREMRSGETGPDGHA